MQWPQSVEIMLDLSWSPRQHLEWSQRLQWKISSTDECQSGQERRIRKLTWLCKWFYKQKNTVTYPSSNVTAEFQLVRKLYAKFMKGKNRKTSKGSLIFREYKKTIDKTLQLTWWVLINQPFLQSLILIENREKCSPNIVRKQTDICAWARHRCYGPEPLNIVLSIANLVIFSQQVTFFPFFKNCPHLCTELKY